MPTVVNDTSFYYPDSGLFEPAVSYDDGMFWRATAAGTINGTSFAIGDIIYCEATEDNVAEGDVVWKVLGSDTEVIGGFRIDGEGNANFGPNFKVEGSTGDVTIGGNGVIQSGNYDAPDGGEIFADVGTKMTLADGVIKSQHIVVDSSGVKASTFGLYDGDDLAATWETGWVDPWSGETGNGIAFEQVGHASRAASLGFMPNPDGTPVINVSASSEDGTGGVSVAGASAGLHATGGGDVAAVTLDPSWKTYISGKKIDLNCAAGEFVTSYRMASARFEARRSSVWTLNNSTVTTLIFTDEISDPGSDYATNTGTYTCPVDGVYFFSASVHTDSVNVAGSRQIFLTRNSTSPSADLTDERYANQTHGNMGGTVYGSLSLSHTMYCEAGDVIRVLAHQYTGATRTWGIANRKDLNVFSGQLLWADDE